MGVESGLLMQAVFFRPTFIFVALPQVIADLSTKKVIDFANAIIDFLV